MRRDRTNVRLGDFGFLLANVPGWVDPGIAIAASRCGATGILNIEGVRDLASIRAAIERMRRYARGAFGVKLDADSAVTSDLLAESFGLDCAILVAGDATQENLAQLLNRARACSRRVLIEVTSEEQAARVAALDIDGLIAKGQEAGGAVGEETVYILLQRILSRFSQPVWAHGGIGMHSAAACYAAGAAGVFLDSQLALMPESGLPSRVRAAVERNEGDETVTLGREMGFLYRVYRRPGMPAVESVQELERELSAKPSAEARATWREALESRVNWSRSDSFFWPLGQDTAFAARFAARFPTIAALVDGLRESIALHVAAAQEQSPLAAHSPLARAHGTAFPIFQGPMTRVSDTAAFAANVAEGGGLPFLALALLRAPQVRKLLEETKRAVGDRPWGVGILGFVPSDLRAEQLEVVREFRPPFAIIAGGRPDQAARIAQDGTVCYLHVPAPALLELFIRDGARRFVFEGRECGGHIGPRTSFVLWESMIEVVQSAITGGIPAEQFHLAFAGGIHDARSAAMVAAMTGPLAAQGVRIGVLLGTAYLFTREAVESGAIVEAFQDEARRCSNTVVLESGPGHATRCADTPFYGDFRQTKRGLIEARASHDAVREELERLNLGRLRVASKGVAKVFEPGGEAQYVAVSQEAQRSEGMYMIGQLAALRDEVCSIRELHEEVSAAGDRYLQSIDAARVQPADDLGKEEPCDIAIVGMSCVLPQAPDVATFWANLVNKVDAITEVPRERFNIDLYYDPDPKAQDKIYTRWGGFIDEVPFEPMRYGIPPTALPSIDPMQLLSLIVVDRALEDAGYRTREFPREKTSVIFGTSGGLGDLGGHYAVRSSLSEFVSDVPEKLLDQLPEWTEDSFAGLLPNVAAGRVANRFNLGGVNFTVDAACASSMAAVYVAARELTSRSSDMVIVGGVDTVQSPFCFLCFSKAQALSPRGRCRPFDESADGIAISEGITVLVMKRLADAERDGDRIYSVVKAVSGSSDGRGRSMTAPRREGQKLVLRRAYRQAGFSPATVGLIEAHGTGTAAGDTTELSSLAEVLVESGAAERSCGIGSVKSAVGHTKAAAGVTGLMKIALALYHKVLPPTLHVEKPNSQLCAPGSPLFVAAEAQPWLPPVDAPRRAGASSFGFGGTNFHAVLEEYTGEFRNPADLGSVRWRSEMFVWSAPTPSGLATALEGLSNKLQRGARPELHELAAALSRRAGAGRPGGARLAIVAASLDDLTARIEEVRGALAAGREHFEQPGVYLSLNSSQPGQIAFLFPGQGSQSSDMLRDLALYFPEFRASLETADRVLAGRLPKRLSSYIFPPPAFTPEKKKEQLLAITDTLIAQPALGAVEIALARLLQRLGVNPGMTAGHSYGEYVALCCAGVFPEETLFRLSEARGRAIKEAAGPDAGSMIAAEASAEAVSAAVEGLAGITIANYNSPQQTVLAGAVELLGSALKRLQSAGINAVRIPVSCAFHSPLVAGARDRLVSVLAEETFARPERPVFSNATGEQYPQASAEIARLLGDHLAQPVRFVDEIRAMYLHGARIFLEVGPKAVLSGLTRKILDAADALIVPLDVNGRHGVTSLLETLGQLFVRGVPVDTGELFRGRSRTALDLDKLEPASKDPSQWLVNGGSSYQRSHPPQPIVPLELTRTIEVEKVIEVPVAAPAPLVAPAGVAMAGPAMANADAVMAPFQQLMGQFLQTQAAVMLAYLQGAPGGISVAPPMPEVSQTFAPATTLSIPAPPPAVRAPVPAREPAPAPVAATADRRAAARDVLADLVRIASDRTGYPAEILDVKAGIESDLGIDSIKRVEILSSFQQLLSAEEQVRVQGAMEKLTAAPSLEEISKAIIEALGKAPGPAEHSSPAPGAANLAVPSSAGASGAARNVLGELVRIASDRTGYPADILDVHAGIESDLGIDSIKRVEILSSFQQLCTPEEQSRLQGAMEKLTSASSLAEIARQIDLVLGADPAGLPDKTTRDATPAADIPRFTFGAVDRPREGTVDHYPGRVCLVTDDEAGIASGIADAWKRAGQKVLLLRHSAGAPLAVNGVLTGDLSDASTVKELVQMVRAQFGPIGALVHLLPLRVEAGNARNSLAEWRDHLAQDVKSLYALVRECEGDLRQIGAAGGALVAVATGRSGTFALQEAISSPPTHQAIADFTKTVAQEIPDVLCKIIDLDPSDPVSILVEKLLIELNSSDATLQVGLPGDRRLNPVVRAAALPGTPVLRPGPDWVFLLTGGARGITAALARLIGERYRPVVILAGTTAIAAEGESPETSGITDKAQLKGVLTARLRSAGSAVRPADIEASVQRVLREREIRGNIETLKRAGARVEYHAVDVRDEAGFGAFIDSIYARHGRLDVVIHGAGVIEDKLIRDKVPESFDRVVGTKADSVYILERKLRPDSLKCLLLMSSVAAAFGNRGQADYGAANGIMNGMAARLAAAWGTRVVSVNWGPWDQENMVPDRIRKQFVARGIQIIPLLAGAEAALREIEYGSRQEPVVVLGAGPWSGSGVRQEALHRARAGGVA